LCVEDYASHNLYYQEIKENKTGEEDFFWSYIHLSISDTGMLNKLVFLDFDNIAGNG
jgi:hypothetical protein